MAPPNGGEQLTRWGTTATQRKASRHRATRATALIRVLERGGQMHAKHKIGFVFLRLLFFCCVTSACVDEVTKVWDEGGMGGNGTEMRL